MTGENTVCGVCKGEGCSYCRNMAQPYIDRIEVLEGRLERIRQWCGAYPRTVFIEPTDDQWAAAHKALNRDDCPSLTAISGSNMRHVVEGLIKHCEGEL